MKKDELIKTAYELFDRFYNDTREYREKCQNNEEFWMANHWDGIAKREPGEPQPVTPVLFSTLENLLADMLDNYPQAVILGEEPSDEKTATRLTKYIKYILKRRHYREVFRNKCRSMLKKGTSVQEVFWDSELYGGLGDINIREVDMEGFLWDEDCSDLQESRACFKFTFHPKQWFEQRYAELVPHFKSEKIERVGKNNFNNEEYLLIEYWYKKFDKKTGRNNVHMAKLAGGVLLECSEDEFPNGIYEHGLYPFIMEALYPIGGKMVGLSLIDIFKNTQIYADKLDQIIVKNALMSGKMKILINKNADMDEQALTDWSCEVVRGNRIDDASVRWFQPQQLSPSVMVHYNNKLSSIKEESGQNLFSRGEVGQGVTAASAIMALQEAGSKRSRLLINQLYDGFEKLVRMVIELMCENYTEARYVRLDGEQTMSIDRDMLLKENRDGSMRSIDFDVSVNIEKQLPYHTLYQNELALGLLKSGVIMPDEAISMMSFEGKDVLLEKVQLRMQQSQQQEQ